jgi:cellulose biosynthesis protein BcsQ
MDEIVITNRKGGVGKTTTSVDLGSALAARNRVLLVNLVQAHDETPGGEQ